MKRHTAKRILKVYFDKIKMSDYVRKRLELDIEHALDDTWDEGHRAAELDFEQWKEDNLQL